MPQCRACGAEIEWVRDGSQMVPVDADAWTWVLPPRSWERVARRRWRYAVYAADGKAIVGRRVPAGTARAVRGRELHWGTCEAVGAREKQAAVGGGW